MQSQNRRHSTSCSSRTGKTTATKSSTSSRSARQSANRPSSTSTKSASTPKILPVAALNADTPAEGDSQLNRSVEELSDDSEDPDATQSRPAARTRGQSNLSEVKNIASEEKEESDNPILIFKSLANLVTMEELKNPNSQDLFDKARSFFGL